ncbi:hypothetical protein BaRGS_00012080, partial [Batillaria attramentaria]
VTGGQYCYVDNPYFPTYCRYGCCGVNNSECCNIGVGLIIGACVGSIFLLAAVVSVVCCCIKKQGYRGRVVGPQVAGGGANVTVVQASGYAPHPGYGPGLAPQPPPPYHAVNPYNNAAMYAYSSATYPSGPSQGFAAPAAPAYAPPQGPKGF